MTHRYTARRGARTGFATVMLAGLLLASGGVVLAQAVEQSFNRGVELYQKKDFEGALTEFQAARKTAPTNVTVLQWVGYIDIRLKKYEDAIEPLQKAIALKSDEPRSHEHLGNAYDGLKRYDDAVKEFAKVIELQPMSGDAHFNLGNVYYKQKKYPEAIASYQKAAEFSPNDALVQQNLGLAFSAANNFQKSAEAHLKATQLDPNNPTQFFYLALASQEQAKLAAAKNTPAAKASAEKAWQQSREAYLKAISLSPDDYQLREAYGESLSDMDKHAEAIVQFNKAAKIQPNSYITHLNLGMSYSRTGQTENAAASYAQAVKARPDSTEALKGLGAADYKLGKWADAKAAYTDLTKKQPKDASNWLYLASTLQKQGDDDGAIAALEESVKQGVSGPKGAQAHRALANALYRKGDSASLERAQTEYLASLKLAADSPEAYNGLGLIAQKQKKADEAIKNFEKATTMNPKFADAFNNLGVAYESKKETTKAQEAYRKALAADPNHATAKRNLARFEKK